MTARGLLTVTVLLAACSAVVFAYQNRPSQNRWARYEAEMQSPIDDPPDANDRTEFAFARLRYRSPQLYVHPTSQFARVRGIPSIN